MLLHCVFIHTKDNIKTTRVNQDANNLIVEIEAGFNVPLRLATKDKKKYHITNLFTVQFRLHLTLSTELSVCACYTVHVQRPLDLVTFDTDLSSTVAVQVGQQDVLPVTPVANEAKVR